MDFGVVEIAELSLLFAVPAAVVMLAGFAAIGFAAFRANRKCPVSLRYQDLLMPVAATGLWCALQSYSLHTKSLGNLAELSILGLIWGTLFVVREIPCFSNGKCRGVWRYVAIELVAVVMSALFAPTFPE